MAPTLPQKRTSGGNLHTFFRKGLTNLLHKEKSLRAITMYADRVSLDGNDLTGQAGHLVVKDHGKHLGDGRVFIGNHCTGFGPRRQCAVFLVASVSKDFRSRKKANLFCRLDTFRSWLGKKDQSLSTS